MANQVEKTQVEEQAVETTETTASVKTMKRGTIIQAVKAVAVLVCICLVCGALLALCNDLFYISDEERFNRSMAKIYPELDLSSVKTVDLNSQFAKNPSYGEVKSVVTDGKVYIIEALGSGGYQNGTVTLYVIVGADAKIISWAVKEHVSQSYIDRVPASAGTTWYVGKDVSNALDLEMTGATVKLTSQAIGNAVNMAAFYCRSALGVGKDPEADSKSAIIELLGEGYSDYNFVTANVLGTTATVGESKKTVKELLTIDGTEISYVMYADGDNGPVKAYVYGKEADTQKIIVFADGEIVLSSNLEQTDELVVSVTDFNSKFYVIKSGSYTGFGYAESNGTSYLSSGIQVGTIPTTYVLNITIETIEGVATVSSIEIKVNGWVPYPSEADANKLASSLVGATLDTINDIYLSDKVTNATESANLIRVAVEAALLDYDAKLASGK